MTTVAALDIEKLSALGKDIGLSGQDLLVFIKTERDELKKQRDEERKIRAEEREDEREKREIEKAKLDTEKAKLDADQARLDADKEKLQTQMEFERQKAEDERNFIREQAEEAEKRKESAHRRNRESRAQREHDSDIEMDEYTAGGYFQNENPGTGGSRGGSRIHPRYIASKIPKLPKFDEHKDNIDAYLMRF